MNLRSLKPSGSAISMIVSIALFAGGSAFYASVATAAEGKSKMSAADAARKRAAVLKMRDDALEDFYATKPEIKADVEKAVGYAVFEIHKSTLCCLSVTWTGACWSRTEPARKHS